MAYLSRQIPVLFNFDEIRINEEDGFLKITFASEGKPLISQRSKASISAGDTVIFKGLEGKIHGKIV